MSFVSWLIGVVLGIFNLYLAKKFNWGIPELTCLMTIMGTMIYFEIGVSIGSEEEKEVRQ